MSEEARIGAALLLALDAGAFVSLIQYLVSGKKHK